MAQSHELPTAPLAAETDAAAPEYGTDVLQLAAHLGVQPEIAEVVAALDVNGEGRVHLGGSSLKERFYGEAAGAVPKGLENLGDHTLREARDAYERAERDGLVYQVMDMAGPDGPATVHSSDLRDSSAPKMAQLWAVMTALGGRNPDFVYPTTQADDVEGGSATVAVGKMVTQLGEVLQAAVLYDTNEDNEEKNGGREMVGFTVCRRKATEEEKLLVRRAQKMKQAA